MACQQDGADHYDYASVPILVTDYLDAPTHWIMSNGNGGKNYQLFRLKNESFEILNPFL